MSKSLDTAKSAPVIPGSRDEGVSEASPLEATVGMNAVSDYASSFIYCDVCHDRTNEERQLAAVMEIANTINSQTDLNLILSIISRELSKVIDYDIGCVAIYDRESNGLFMRHVWRKSGDKSGEGRYVPFDEGNLVGWVAFHRKPVLRCDIASDTRFREIMREDDLKSDIVVPLIAKDTLIGTVNIGSFKPNHFTDFDLDLVVQFGKLTSIAIEKSKVLEELENLGEKYRLLMRNSREIIALLNASGEFVEINRASIEEYGYSKEEIIGHGFFEVLHPKHREAAKGMLSGILKQEITKPFEMPFVKKNGETAFMSISASVIRIKEHPYILVIAHDITEETLLKERITDQNAELKAINRKLKELDDLKNEFLGRISHELRTPLSIIMAYTGTLLEDREQTIDVETRTEFLHVIEAHSNKLLGLINDLLDLSRVEVSQTMLQREEASLNDVIKISVKIAESLADQNRVTLVTDLDDTIPIITFDPLRIRQVCVNLLTNAIKFSDQGATVTISSRNSDREVVVSVRDEGQGIDAEDFPDLFEKFVQLDGGSSRAKEGLGIGLKLVKHFIELHGGWVWVASKRGTGSNFFFSLPKSCPPFEEPS